MHVGSSLSCQCLERERQGRSQSCSSFSTSEPDMLESPVVRSMTREMIKFAWNTGFFNISPFRLPLEMQHSEIGFQEDTTAGNESPTLRRSGPSMGSSCGFTLQGMFGEIFLHEHEEVNSGLPKQMDLQVNGLNLSCTSTIFVRIIENYRKLMH